MLMHFRISVCEVVRLKEKRRQITCFSLPDAAGDIRRQQGWPRSLFLPFAGGCRRPLRAVLQPRDVPRKQEDLDRRCSARRNRHAASVVLPREHVGRSAENANASPHASTQRGRRGSGLLEGSP